MKSVEYEGYKTLWKSACIYLGLADNDTEAETQFHETIKQMNNRIGKEFEPNTYLVESGDYYPIEAYTAEEAASKFMQTYGGDLLVGDKITVYLMVEPESFVAKMKPERVD